jgi:S1-C subfamily serine protease
MRTDVRKLLIVAALGIVVLAAATGGAIADRVYNIYPLDMFFPQTGRGIEFNQKIVNEDSVVIDVAKKVSPSVVSISVQVPTRRILQFGPGGFTQGTQGGQTQEIGTGFIVSVDGLIVTNKHVVSDASLTYSVVTKDGKQYKADKISRDPSNDIAVIKISASGLTPIVLGDSGNLQVGQFVIAIGTALGQFPDTVTTGVVSGLGRGIQAGSDFQGYVEQLDNVIQTDAAINPGNSGGPLLNSAGQVIGINVAVAQGAQNIGFAIPVNIVKAALSQFQATGSFPAKAYLGVEYQMVPAQSAILNNVPQGAYVVNVVNGSPAEKAGIQPDDIISKMDGQALTDTNGGLSAVIGKKKPGDSIALEIWRNGETIKTNITLSEASQ